MDERPDTVVIAEDEYMVRVLVAELLTDAGFKVVEVAHALAALATLTTRAPFVAVLFVDINMPGPMNGLELARHVRGRWPWIGVLITSGKAAPPADEIPEGTRFLPKPYDPGQIVARVRELATLG